MIFIPPNPTLKGKGCTMTKIADETAISKAYDKLAAMPNGKAKWIAFRDFMIKTNETHRFEHNAIVQEAKETRRAAFNKYGASLDGNSSLRQVLKLPPTLLAVLETVDTTFHDRFTSKEKPVYRKLMKELREAFPEYTTADVF